MDREDVKKGLEGLKKVKKRNFAQSYDLIIVLRDYDVKSEEGIDAYITLHYPKGKEDKICAIVGPELAGKAEVFDKVIKENELDSLKGDKKKLKGLAREYDVFIAQANLMPQVATVFGKVLGPRGKMPNPKRGGVFPPNANLEALNEKLKKTVRVAAKDMPMMQCIVGKEDMEEDQVIDNVMTIYNAVLKSLPHREGNIKKVLLKKTMSKPVRING